MGTLRFVDPEEREDVQLGDILELNFSSAESFQLPDTQAVINIHSRQGTPWTGLFINIKQQNETAQAIKGSISSYF